MLRTLARRVATAAVTLWLVTLSVFGLIHLAPGGPLGASQAEDGLHRVSPEAAAEVRALYRLDRPLIEQYGLWLRDVLHGDLGRSFHDRREVSEKIGERVGVTLLLNACAIALMVGLALPAGALAALRPGSWWDRLSGVLAFALYAMPAFWAALLLQIVVAERLDWLPLAGVRSPDWDRLGAVEGLVDRAAHLVLPVLCLSYGGLAYLARFVRANLIDSVAAESWRAARARGLSAAAVLRRHGLRQAGVPMLTLAGFLLPALFGGSVIVETIFAIPGIGRLFVEAAFQRDVPVLMGLTLLSGTATLAGMLAADLAYAVVDPRVRRA